MKLLSRMLAVAVLSLLATFSFTDSALACKCMMPTPTDARDNAAAVFEGHVTAIGHEGGDGASGMGTNVVSLKIVRTWKGVASQETVEVRTADQTAACGIFFEVGKSYLVYATQGDKGLQAGSCMRTRNIEGAEEDFAALGAGVTPVKVDAPKVDVPKAVEGTKPAEEEAQKPPAARTSSCGYSSSSKGAVSSLLFATPALGMVLARRRSRGARGAARRR